jgi:2-succinyl-5-enolpyruvyl-6-hydroxy-3-cyclohexene-1-carboxylate synthase
METTSFTHIEQLIDILYQNNIKTVVISPGSRNAPLIIGFDSHPDFKTYVVHDERSAAFFALGIADEKKEGVAIVCTSGSAPLNYAPAVAEAYYRQVPLLVLTADRPKELIDQGDGQCIRQLNVFSNYIKYSSEFCVDSKLDIIDKALINLLHTPQGPVHINLPLEEPLYGTTEKKSEVKLRIHNKDHQVLSKSDQKEIETEWKSYSKKLIIVGQMYPNQKLQLIFDALADDSSVAILVENTSNLKRFTKFCHSIDRTLALISEDEIEDFRPDVLVSVGGAIISKKIKKFFRDNKPKVNWRVGEFLLDEDTYQSKTKNYKVSPIEFFGFINQIQYLPESNFGNKWKSKDFNSYDAHDQFIFNAPFSDLKVFDFIIDTLPEGVSFQMANSSVVRYCQLFEPIGSVNYYANRGVSGIDGSTSTALGMAVANPDRFVVLVTGDISFFYDSNALWNTYLPDNLRIVLINNNGGGIFNIIDGPSTAKQNEIFVAPHAANAQKICEAFDVGYLKASSMNELETVIGDFYTQDNTVKTKVLEINTALQSNGEVLKSYFKHLSKSIK